MKSMEIVDANVVLRYLLNDNEIYSRESAFIIEKTDIYIPFEVLAEVVYVLEKVYDVPRKDILNALSLLIEYPNIETNNKKVFQKALETYHIKNIDFIDAILIGYNHLSNATIHTFDKKLKRLCK
jgi:predicted nucleic-acid-binding protein